MAHAKNMMAEDTVRVRPSGAMTFEKVTFFLFFSYKEKCSYFSGLSTKRYIVSTVEIYLFCFSERRDILFLKMNVQYFLTFTTLLTHSADDKLMI